MMPVEYGVAIRRTYMFQLQSELGLRLKHLHDDGTWSQLERVQQHDDPAEHDPERAWASGRLYRCTRCDEQVMVTSDVEGDPAI
jgi:hypothetical protein